MANWTDFATAQPATAARARGLIERTGTGEGLLATVRGDGAPRIHPVNVGIVDGRLVTWVIRSSAKAADLATDGRFALHAHQDPAVPHEFQVRGRATAVTDPVLRAAASEWAFEVDDGYVLYELVIEHAVFGERASADAWPPVYTSWRPSAA
jgi:Pyridoxamine 5'-phosphate oxidase